MNTAAKVRQHKLEHPELYCPNPRCLHRTAVHQLFGGIAVKPCPKHQGTCTCENNGDYCVACTKVLEFTEKSVDFAQQMENLKENLCTKLK